MGDSDEEGYLAWLNAGQPIYQEGAGYVGANGQLTNWVPTDPAQQVPQLNPASDMWEYEKAQNTGFNYTPEQLGWSATESARFADAGITKLPEWFNKPLVYSGAFHLGSNEPVSSFISLYNTPMDEAKSQWSGSKKAAQYLTGSGGSVDDPEFKEAYIRNAFGTINNARDSWWDRNKGWVIGGGGMLSVVAGGLAGALAEGATAGLEAGAVGAEAGSGGGGLFGTTAGLSSTGGTGLYGTGLGLEGTGLGGLYGTGVGVSGGFGDLAAVGAGGTLQGLDGLGGDVYGYNNTTPMVQGADGTWSVPPTDVSGELTTSPNLFGQSVTGGGLYGTGTNLPVAAGGTGSTTGGLFGTGIGTSEALGATGVGAASAGGSIWDSITNLLSPSGGQTTTGGTDWMKLLGPLLGVGGAVAGGVLGNNAIQDSIDKMQKYYEPFYNLGVSNIPALNAADPTGGSGQFIDQLKNYGTNFEFDYNNPAYTQQLAETTRINDQNLAARGMYNSRAGLNLQDQSARNLVTTEYDKQYARGYGNLTDLFTMTNQNAGTSYNKLLDMVKIGSGASGSAGQGALAGGQSSANLYAGLGAMPMNYAILTKLLGGK